MHNPESVRENETHKSLWDFEIRTDHVIVARRPDLIIVKKKKKKRKNKEKENLQNCGLCWVKLKESENEDKYFDLARELKKLENESDRYTNCNWCTWYSYQRIGKRTRGFRNKRTNGDNPNYSIAEVGKNTEKSLGDLRRLAVIQTPVKDRQQTLTWKTLKE